MARSTTLAGEMLAFSVLTCREALSQALEGPEPALDRVQMRLEGEAAARERLTSDNNDLERQAEELELEIEILSRQLDTGAPIVQVRGLSTSSGPDTC